MKKLIIVILLFSGCAVEESLKEFPTTVVNEVENIKSISIPDNRTTTTTTTTSTTTITTTSTTTSTTTTTTVPQTTTTTTTVPQTTTTSTTAPIICQEVFYFGIDSSNWNDPSCPRYYLEASYNTVVIGDISNHHTHTLYCYDNDYVEVGGARSKNDEGYIAPFQQGLTEPPGHGWYIKIQEVTNPLYEYEKQQWENRGQTEGPIWIWIICINQ